MFPLEKKIFYSPLLVSLLFATERIWNLYTEIRSRSPIFVHFDASCESALYNSVYYETNGEHLHPRTILQMRVLSSVLRRKICYAVVVVIIPGWHSIKLSESFAPLSQHPAPRGSCSHSLIARSPALTRTTFPPWVTIRCARLSPAALRASR